MHSENLILLTEDSEADELLFKLALKHSALANPLKITHDGDEAIAYLTGQRQFADRQKFPMPSILVLDLMLPKMDGWEVLQWIRSRREFDHLLVVVLTGAIGVEGLQRAYRLGANYFLFKPCRAEDLVSLAYAFPAYWLRSSGRSGLSGGHALKLSTSRHQALARLFSSTLELCAAVSALVGALCSQTLIGS